MLPVNPMRAPRLLAISALNAYVLVGCGGSTPPANTEASPLPSSSSTVTDVAPQASAATTNASAPTASPPATPPPAAASTPGAGSGASAGGTNLTKDDLAEATKIVYAGYGKDKFAAVVKKVEAKLGPAQKKEPKMLSWFAKDGDKCVQFWVTQGDKGFAATGTASDTDAAKTGCN
jgi:hypothetical protein